MGIWPEGKKCAVALCFDLDADTLWFDGPRGTTPTPASLGEYGARVCAPRIMEFLAKHNLPATWFIPGYTVRKYPEIVQEIDRRGHETGHHGYYHEHPVQMEREEEKKILAMGLEAYEDVVGKRPLGYRSPAWDLSENSIDLLTEYGFQYDSSMMTDEKPFMLAAEQTGKELVEIPVEWVLDDAPYFMFNFNPKYRVGLSDPDKVLRIWIDEFDGYYENGSSFVLTMHPQIIGRYHRMKMLEQLVEHMLAKGDVWFTRCIDIAEHWKKRGKSA